MTQATTLDENGVINTPTSGYTEPDLGGTTNQFHGPFQRWMNSGTHATKSDNDGKIGKRIHLIRAFRCSRDESTFRIRYTIVYCKNNKNFAADLIVSAGDHEEHFFWYPDITM